MRLHHTKTLLISLLVSALPLSAHAFRPWLQPSATVLDGRENWVTVDAAGADNAFELEGAALPLDGLLVLDPDAKVISPLNQSTGKLRSTFDLKLEKAGTYRISLVRETAMASYKQGGEQKRWRGDEKDLNKSLPADAQEVQVTHQTQRQETFVSVGQPSKGNLQLLSGEGIELLPLTHPNSLYVGESARFRLLLDGQPLSNFLISIVPGGVRYRGVLNEIAVTTDANGEFSVKWPSAGLYWLGVSWPARAEGVPQAMPSRRASYAATFEVLPE